MLPQNAVLQVVAQMKDSNLRGDMFGGWIMGLMDLAGVIPIARQFNNEIATAAVNHIQFLKPIFVGAHVAVDAELTRVGNTSATVDISVYATEGTSSEYHKVATGQFVYVAISQIGKPTHLTPRN